MWGRQARAESSLDVVVEFLQGIGITPMSIDATPKEIHRSWRRPIMGRPERRRRRRELNAEAEMYRAQAKAIFADVEKRLEERRARANRSLFRRLFGGRRAA